MTSHLGQVPFLPLHIVLVHLLHAVLPVQKLIPVPDPHVVRDQVSHLDFHFFAENIVGFPKFSGWIYQG